MGPEMNDLAVVRKTAEWQKMKPLVRLGMSFALPSTSSACDISLALQQPGPMSITVGFRTANTVHAEVPTEISGDSSPTKSVVTVIDPNTGTVKIESLSMLQSEILEAVGWPEFVQFQ